MNNKIVSLNQLKDIKKKCHKNGNKVVLVHGVFDVIHIGHLDHFKDAKSYGDILVVSLTSDEFVNKGFNQPYFKVGQRCNFLSHIDLIDYITVSNSNSSIEVIKILKPDFYCKGIDYKPRSGDKAGNLQLEKNTTEKYGGKLIFTKGQQFSSTKILNENFQEFKLVNKEVKKFFKNDIQKNNALDDFYSTLKSFKNKKILIIGEIIIDTYINSSPIGTPSKESILSVNYQNKTSFLGGAVPIVKNISQLNNNITFVSLFKENSLKNKVKRYLGKKVKLKFFKQKNYKEVNKNRFINDATKAKFFEYYDFNNIEYENKLLSSYLNQDLKKFDRVIICDFGHGLFSKKIINTLIKKSKFICANVQTNSGNRGFNLFTKYSKLDYLSIDEPEARLGLSEKNLNIMSLIKDKRMKKYQNLMITRGIDGLIIKISNNKNNNDIVKFPALNVKVIDTLGAGDAVYSYASCLVKSKCDPRLLALVGAIAGALKTNILGHSSWVSLKQVERSLEAILK